MFGVCLAHIKRRRTRGEAGFRNTQVQGFRVQGFTTVYDFGFSGKLEYTLLQDQLEPLARSPNSALSPRLLTEPKLLLCALALWFLHAGLRSLPLPLRLPHIIKLVPHEARRIWGDEAQFVLDACVSADGVPAAPPRECRSKISPRDRCRFCPALPAAAVAHLNSSQSGRKE